MKKNKLERSVVALLFVLVLVLFSFAERDTEKMFELYRAQHPTTAVKKPVDFTASTAERTVDTRTTHTRN